jgi:predicted HTH transcriptional regulator
MLFSDGSPIARFEGADHMIAFPELPAQQRATLELIRQGESERCEFKALPAKPVDKIDNSFWEKILKTCCAFANTEGGTLLIGVSDDAELVGIDAAPQSDAETAAACRDELRRIAIKRLRDNLHDAPAIAVDLVLVSERYVLCLVVPFHQSSAPCTVRGDQAYIRRGATTRRPTADEYRQLLNPGAAVIDGGTWR